GPNEVTKFSQYGFGFWGYGPGVPYQKRLDLMPAGYTGDNVSQAASLLHFFSISDIHITDKESPAEAIYYGYKWNIISGYSPSMLYTTHMLNAAVKTINGLHQTKSFDFGLSLGDAINSSQYNELRWFMDVMDGKFINPDSGVKDDPNPGPNNDYQDEYKAEGLDPSIKWYQTLGNHDHIWMGMFPPDTYVRERMTGSTILELGNIFTDKAGLATRGFYMGAIDGKTVNGEIVGAGPVSSFAVPPTVPADKNRFPLAKKEVIGEFLKSTSQPAGHGFTAAMASTGFANYTFEPKSDIPIKVIALDNTNNADKPVTDAYGKGYIDKERYDWLVAELDKGQAEGKLMIIAAHIPIKVKIDPSTLLGQSMIWSRDSYKNEDEMLATLHNYPNLILWVSGHRHLSVVTPQPSPDPAKPELGFWEVETPSLREYPQQFRTFQIVRNSDNTISIFAADVDPVAPEGSLVARARSYAIAANQLFKIVQDPMPTGVVNVELIKKLSLDMQNKIKLLGKPLNQ
ncbi:MAG: TIGR03768 family metallophosphoesterase, partial [Chitinophagaceae bacterium]